MKGKVHCHTDLPSVITGHWRLISKFWKCEKRQVSRALLCHHSTRIVSANSNKTNSCLPYRAIDIIHLSTSHFFPHNTHTCLAASTEETKSYLTIISLGQYNSASFPHNRAVAKWFIPALQ